MTIYAHKNFQVLDFDDLTVIDGAEITVRHEAAGSPLAALKSDRTGTGQSNPYTAADGEDAGFYAANGVYMITATKDGFTRTWRYEPLYDPIVGLAGLDDGTAAAPALSFINDPDTGLYRIGANNIGVSVNGSLIFSFSTSGMGTAAPIFFTDGTVGAPSISFGSDADTGVYRIGANNIGIAAGGSKIIDIGSAAVSLTVPTTISDTTNATSPSSSAALKVAGGMTLAKDLWIADGHLLSVGSASPAAGTFNQITLNGPTSGSNGGVLLQADYGGSFAWGICNLSGLNGGSYNNKTVFASAHGLRVIVNTSGAPPTLTNALIGIWSSDSNGDVTGISSTGTGNVVLAGGTIAFASGTVFSWNSGDVTLTHSSNLLAFAGASSGYTFDALVSPASNDGAALGSASVSFADLFLASGGVVNWNNGNTTLTHAADLLTIGGASLKVNGDYAANGYTLQAGDGTGNQLVQVASGAVASNVGAAFLLSNGGTLHSAFGNQSAIFGGSTGTTTLAGTTAFRFTNTSGTLTATLTIGGGWQVGASPTGGDKGAGTINCSGDIYKNNTAYTNPDYVLEHYFTGKIERFAKNEGAAAYGGLMPLNELQAHLAQHHRLPGIGDEPMGMFKRADVVLEKIEQLFLYAVEGKVATDHLAAQVADLRQQLLH